MIVAESSRKEESVPCGTDARAVGVTVNNGREELGIVSKEGLSENSPAEGIKLEHELMVVVHDNGQGEVKTELE